MEKAVPNPMEGGQDLWITLGHPFQLVTIQTKADTGPFLLSSDVLTQRARSTKTLADISIVHIAIETAPRAHTTLGHQPCGHLGKVGRGLGGERM